MHRDEPRRITAQTSTPATIQPGRRWLRVRAAAAYLAIGVGTLNKLRVLGGGPPYSKLGHTVVYDSTDLDAWVAARRVRSTSERVRAA